MPAIDSRNWIQAAREQERRIFSAWIQRQAAEVWVVPGYGLWPWGPPTACVTQERDGQRYRLLCPRKAPDGR